VGSTASVIARVVSRSIFRPASGHVSLSVAPPSCQIVRVRLCARTHMPLLGRLQRCVTQVVDKPPLSLEPPLIATWTLCLVSLLVRLEHLDRPHTRHDAFAATGRQFRRASSSAIHTGALWISVVLRMTVSEWRLDLVGNSSQSYPGGTRSWPPLTYAELVVLLYQHRVAECRLRGAVCSMPADDQRVAPVTANCAARYTQLSGSAATSSCTLRDGTRCLFPCWCFRQPLSRFFSGSLPTRP